MLEQSREKAIRLVDYIRFLSQIRTTQLRKIEDYEQVLWFSDIPMEDGCFTQMWVSESEAEQDIWIEVKYSKEPPIPKIPDICSEFVVRSSLNDKQNLPLLDFNDPVSFTMTNLDDQHNFLDNDDNHDKKANQNKIIEAWDKYCEYEWLPWVDLHNNWDRKSRIYSQLFAIHQAILKLGEEFELVVGFGLLSWKTPQNQDIHRHVIVANAQLEFERRHGTFTVRPMIDGSNIRIELDMLELEQQQLLQTEELKTELQSAEVNPWRDNVIQNVLKNISHSIHHNGQFIDTGQPNNIVFKENPIIEFAPALILRKRSSSGLVAILDDIKKSIQDGVDIPSQFCDLAEISKAHKSNIFQHVNSNIIHEEEVYFPKPSNEEQYKIITMLNKSDGLLVQGPPGTGKSHTIANLVCHLLATGKRILVTAKTPRALLVLENLIPLEVRPLSINLLGDGVQEKQSLELSVKSILNNTVTWNQLEASVRITKIKTDLNELLKEQTSINNRIRDIRESETKSHTIAEDSYTGTASTIAQTIDKEKEFYDWFKDKLKYDQNFSIDQNLIIQALRTLRRISEDRRMELQMSFPADLLSPEDFASLCEREKALTHEIEALLFTADESVTSGMLVMEPSLLKDFLQTIRNYRIGLNQLEVQSLPWMLDFLRDIIKNQLAILLDLKNKSKSILNELGALPTGIDNYDIHYPEEIPLNTILTKVISLKSHILAGGKLGWWLFRPRAVRESLTYLKRVTLNGESITTYDRLVTLERVLHIHNSFQQVWKYWAGRCNEHPCPLSMQYAQLEDLVHKLDFILGLNELVQEIRSYIQLYELANEPDLMSAKETSKLYSSVDLAMKKTLLQNVRQEFSGVISSLTESLNTLNAHPIVHELESAIIKRNMHDYNLLYQNLSILIQDSKELLQAFETLRDLSTTLPILSSDLLQTCNDVQWDGRLASLEQTWHWAQANSWLVDYIGNADVPSMNERLSQILKDISSIKSEQAAILAWEVLYHRLSDNHRSHMEAWKQAITRVGKGKGKYAPMYRREAQYHLNECREAIPAWIMPLHRVWDTIKPIPGMFDVVIVDEASQCGFEGLPLYYLGKKIIIVGDDKQISPEAVGIQQGAVFSFMNKCLVDYQFKDSFNITSSLYDHARLRFSSSSVSLREHFRCMPEIIKFSNQLCYNETPLIPLRQYGTERLAPLAHTYVSNGYREGKESKVINRPEAIMIADKIMELCHDNKYNEKTMGVIVLQGEAQAGLIEQELLKRIDVSELEQRRLICGNPYSFQGDERDVIFLSLVAATNERIGPFTSDPDTRRFNVAASRAKEQMWLFHSVKPEDLNPNDLRRRFLEHFMQNKTNTIAGFELHELSKRSLQDNRSILVPPHPFDSWFEVDVAFEIARRDYEVIPQFEIAGKRIDLVVEGGQARLAIECDGDRWHGIDQYEKDMLRQRQLERCGWNFWRVRGSSFYANRIEAMAKLWKTLDDRGIYPLRKRQLIAMGINADINDNQGLYIVSDDEIEHGIEDCVFSNGNHENSGNRHVDDVTQQDVFISIISVLKGCPNNSCTIKSMPTRILQDMGVITRGNPRIKFERLVEDCLNVLIIKNHIWKYKTSKNLRVRLNPDNL